MNKKMVTPLSVTAYILVAFFTSCHPQVNPWEKVVPNRDIMFQTDVQKVNGLSFIQSDGTEHEVLELTSSFVKPVWSSDGSIIYGLSNPFGQFPYEDIGYPAFWDLENYKFKLCAEDLPYFINIEEYTHSITKKEVILANAFEILIYDIENCQKTQILVDNNNGDGLSKIQGVSYFEGTQELLYGYITKAYHADREYHIIKMDLINGSRIDLAKGINPVWSPDGTQIAFIGLDGLYVTAPDGANQKQVLNETFFNYSESGSPEIYAPQPRWSFDGEWIVYHQCINKFCNVKETPIYKVRVKDGTKEEIIIGGKYPSWQP